jgi:hypothetical protein
MRFAAAGFNLASICSVVSGFFSPPLAAIRPAARFTLVALLSFAAVGGFRPALLRRSMFRLIPLLTRARITSVLRIAPLGVDRLAALTLAPPPARVPLAFSLAPRPLL